jgi:hypothetical protein
MGISLYVGFLLEITPAYDNPGLGSSMKKAGMTAGFQYSFTTAFNT